MKTALACLVLLFACLPSANASLTLGMVAVNRNHSQNAVTGYVTGIADGDTLYMMIDGQSTRIRLAQIDAPEKGQPFGRRAEQSLRDLVGKKLVSAEWSEIDQYGRPIAMIFCDGININAEMVRSGFAWAFRAYLKDKSLIDLESQAKAAKLGLWADDQPVAPWDWRKDHRSTLLPK